MDIDFGIMQLFSSAFDESNKSVLTRDELIQFVQLSGRSVSRGTLGAYIVGATVNNPNRIHYSFNQEERVANKPYDLLYALDSRKAKSGRYQRYIPDAHGIWKIVSTSSGAFKIVNDVLSAPPATSVMTLNIAKSKSTLMLTHDDLSHLPSEACLRDFIAANLSSVFINGRALRLYRDNEGNEGMEYRTSAGTIDLLAVDACDEYCVFEFKLHRGVDKAVGQICRYIGWVRSHLADGKEVHGVILCKDLDDKIAYACSAVPGVILCTYSVDYRLMQVGNLTHTASPNLR